MSFEVDWVAVLVECRDAVKAAVEPHLETLKAPQPDLGMGAGGDAMKLVDLAAEKAIVQTMQKNQVSFTLISEESGIKEFGDTPKDYYVTVDPIDGTTNLTRGLPFYCSSIAVSRKPVLSQVVAGMVTDLYHGTTYTAVKDKGAFRDGKKIVTSAVTSMQEAVIGLDLNTYKVREVAPQLTDLIAVARHIRHFGANALELCFVADGLTDAFLDIRGKIRTTDIAAGFLIIKEAGGIVSSPSGEAVDVPLDPKQQLKFVASGNQTIHKTLLGLVKPATGQ
ncbi:MAG: fructose 1,6-bisphosphatase [Candidatus Bathyarchaeota archaeon]|nr:fructose 1,6-bisphosphatase [Candidatus Bathyarchaeota archaeon]